MFVFEVGKVLVDVVGCFWKEVWECEEGEEWGCKELNGKGMGLREDGVREIGDKDVDKFWV